MLKFIINTHCLRNLNLNLIILTIKFIESVVLGSSKLNLLQFHINNTGIHYLYVVIVYRNTYSCNCYTLNYD